MSDIVERLRAQKWHNIFSGAQQCRTFYNPNGPEAADLIESLQRDNEAMREALVRISRETGKSADGFIDWQRCVDRIQAAASTTLKGLNQ